MKADAGGSCIERAGIGPNHPLSEVPRLQSFVAQIVFNELGHRPLEEHAFRFFVLPQPLVNLFAGGSLPDPHIAIASRAQRIAQSAQHIAHRAPALHIARSEAANFRLALLVAIPKLNARSVKERNEEPIYRRRPLKAPLR